MCLKFHAAAKDLLLNFPHQLPSPSVQQEFLCSPLVLSQISFRSLTILCIERDLACYLCTSLRKKCIFIIFICQPF